MTRQLKKVLGWIRDNMDTVHSYPTTFRATLEYVQYLSNNRRDISALHAMIKRLTKEATWPAIPQHNQHTQLNDFLDILHQLADTIETDSTGRWGDNTPPGYTQQYQERKDHFEERMRREWKAVQDLINRREQHFHQTWNAL